MTRKLTALSLTGAALLPAFLAVGCASENANQQPYALTGAGSQAQVEQQHAAWRQQLAYTDQKGKYRTECANWDHPIGYSQ